MDYKNLKQLGFYGVRSTRDGDIFASRKPEFKDFKIVGSYRGYSIYPKHPTRIGQYIDLPRETTKSDLLQAIKGMRLH